MGSVGGFAVDVHAIHEAGHAIVGISFKQFPDEMYLNDGPADADGHTGRTRTGSTDPRNLLGGGPEFALMRWRSVVVAAAGTVAADMAQDRRIDHAEYAYEIVDDEEGYELGTDEAYIVSLAQTEYDIADAYAAAERILTRHWSALEFLAARLMERRRLTRDELWGMPELTDVDGAER